MGKREHVGTVAKVENGDRDSGDGRGGEAGVSLAAARSVGVSRFRQQHPVLVQLVRFAVVGGLGTAVNALIFLVARTWWDAMPANLLAIVLSTVVSTEANCRFTFGDTDAHRWRAHVQSGGTVLFYAFYSSSVLLLLGAVVANPTPPVETLAVALASVLGGSGRFLVLRFWVFGADARRTTTERHSVQRGPASTSW